MEKINFTVRNGPLLEKGYVFKKDVKSCLKNDYKKITAYNGTFESRLDFNLVVKSLAVQKFIREEVPYFTI